MRAQVRVVYRSNTETKVKIGFECGMSALLPTTHILSKKAAVGMEVDITYHMKTTVKDGKAYNNLSIFEVHGIQRPTSDNRFADLPDVSDDIDFSDSRSYPTSGIGRI